MQILHSAPCSAPNLLISTSSSFHFISFWATTEILVSISVWVNYDWDDYFGNNYSLCFNLYVQTFFFLICYLPIVGNILILKFYFIVNEMIYSHTNWVKSVGKTTIFFFWSFRLKCNRTEHWVQHGPEEHENEIAVFSCNRKLKGSLYVCIAWCDVPFWLFRVPEIR